MRVIAFLLLLVPIAGQATPIEYSVNRIIGDGTVTGFFVTDGTLGDVLYDNIIDWELTVFAPNMDSGTPFTMSGSDGDLINSDGAVFIATTTELLFDFASPDVRSGQTGAYTLFRDNANRIGGGLTQNYWCLEVIACSDVTGPSENIGPSGTGGPRAQDVFRTGLVSIANRTVSVPEPGTLGLFGLALAGMCLVRRRRTQQILS